MELELEENGKVKREQKVVKRAREGKESKEAAGRKKKEEREVKNDSDLAKGKMAGERIEKRKGGKGKVTRK